MVVRHQLLSLSSPTFPIWLPQWHLFGFYFQVQLLLRDLLPSGHVLLHWVPALLQAGGYPVGSIASAPLCTEGRGLSRLRLSGFLTQGEILPKMLFFFFFPLREQLCRHLASSRAQRSLSLPLTHC